mmetsp:Transcript_4255/g.10271  ORF Transcript_4255/g.10271 Transcript_4255/m.10271 type:complete len:472 (+) Transcript_4255:138-1553(+)
MSYPAVLFDHVPVRSESEASSTDDGDPNTIESGTAKSVSSMFRRASAPRERKAISNPREKTSDKGHEVADSNGFDSNENGVVNTNDDTDTATGNGRIEQPDEFVTENIDDGDCPLQTIIEDIDQYYVLVPIPPPVLESSKTRQSLVTKTLESIKWSRRCIETVVCADTKGWNALRASVSEFVESYARDCSGLASIISEYDCEAVVDDSGNRLILSGSCTDLQEGDNPEHCQGAALIVPGIRDEGSALPSPPSSSSSMLRSTTIMVSAHDLLAMQRKRLRQRADRYAPDATLVEEQEHQQQDTFLACFDRNDRHFGPEHSALTAVATQHGIQRWKRAFWKLTERKARALSYSARFLVHRYIRETGRRLIQTQCLLNEYYKSMDRYKRRGRMLLSRPYAAIVGREDNTAYLITVRENEDAADPWTLVVVPQGTLWTDGSGDSQGQFPAVEMTRLWHAWNRTRVSRSAQTDSDS